MPSYTVTVATGSQWFAGTDDYIYLSLVGSAGCSEKHLLDKPFYNDFERGAVRARGTAGAPRPRGGAEGDPAEGSRDPRERRGAGRGASSELPGRPGPWGSASRTLSGGWDARRGPFQGEALLPREQGRRKGSSPFHRRGPEALRGPLTGQRLWAASLVHHFSGFLPGVGGEGSGRAPRSPCPAVKHRRNLRAAASCARKRRSGGPEA